ARAENVLSVLYFENTTNNARYKWLSKGLADMLISDITGVPDVTVVERENIEKIIKEQERSVSDLYDEKSAIAIGKLLNANRLIYGSFIILNDTIRIDARLVDVTTAKILNSFEVSGAVKKVLTLEKQLTLEFLKAMGVEVPTLKLEVDTSSLDAAEAYYTGIQLLDEGSISQAAEKFREASKIDPYYLKPKKSLEDAYQFLKDFKRMRYQRELYKLYQKAAEIKKRLAAKEWMTYAQFLTDCYNKGLSNEETRKLAEKTPTLIACDTRAQCTWELEHTLLEIADKSEEYFDDSETGARMHKEILYIVEQSRTQFKDDPFLPEILYMELFALQYFKKWQELMKSCEYLMTTYPDYRMMWAVEDFYERALKKLDEKEKD
ncbi:MAG: CsgG/HfaB family protein, partial [Spirochaetia bacterium]